MPLQHDHESESRSDRRQDAAPSDSAGPSLSRKLTHGALGRLSRDELAQQDICAALLADRGFDGHDIEVEMTENGVILRGSVASERHRAHALEIAAKFAGSRVVRDELTV